MAGRWGRIVIAAVMGGVGAPGAARAQQADYTEAAQRFKAAYALEGLADDPTALDPALDRAFARLDVGLFEVRYPWVQLADARRVEQLRDLLLGLIDLQLRGRAWLDLAADAAPTPPEVAIVRAWIKGWKGEALKKALSGRKADQLLTALAGANDGVLAALEQMKQEFRDGAGFGVPAKGAATRLLLAPTRDAFIGTVAWIGSLSADHRALLWGANLPVRIEAHLDELLILALTSPAPDGNALGIAMDAREKNGLLEHVTQYGADRVIKHLFGAKLDAGLHAGLAVNLVIDLYGENNARLFGSGEGKTIPARERFVPGGRSEGGKLSAHSADSRWRSEKGKDRFVKQLKLAQVEGGKAASKLGEAAPSPFAHFILDEREKPNVKDVAHAPVLGPFAAAQPMPENFFADYQEFLRAYRTAFLHWLATEAKLADGGRRGAARLLRARIERPEATLDALAQELFGVPLTAAEPDSKALEWQFLGWLWRLKL